MEILHAQIGGKLLDSIAICRQKTDNELKSFEVLAKYNLI